MKVRLPQSTIGHYVLSLSGGVDSMVLAHYLLAGRKNFAAIHFNHHTELADSYQKFTVGFCEANGIELTIHQLSAKANTEHEWAAERKEALFKIENCCLTAHHANDRLESMLMGRDLCWNIGNIWRPFIEVPKEEILTTQSVTP